MSRIKTTFSKLGSEEGEIEKQNACMNMIDGNGRIPGKQQPLYFYLKTIGVGFASLVTGTSFWHHIKADCNADSVTTTNYLSALSVSFLIHKLEIMMGTEL